MSAADRLIIGTLNAWGRRDVLCGAALVSSWYFLSLLGGLDAGGGYAESVLAPAVLVMLGIGLLATPLASIATSGVPAADAGVASGVISTCRTMGGALGLAVLATVAASRTGGSGRPEALASGYALAFQVGVAILVACALLMLLVLREGLRPR